MRFLGVIKSKCREVVLTTKDCISSRLRKPGSVDCKVGYNIVLISPHDTEEKRRVGRAVLRHLGMDEGALVEADPAGGLVRVPLRERQQSEPVPMLYNLTGFQESGAVRTRRLLGMPSRGSEGNLPVLATTDDNCGFGFGNTVLLCVLNMASIPLMRDELYPDFEVLRSFKRIVFVGISGEVVASWDPDRCERRHQVLRELVGESLIAVSPETEVGKIVSAMDAKFGA